MNNRNDDRDLTRLPETAERNYKDTLFRKIFREPKELLTLYNAINGTSYQNPDDLEIVTLENAIYMNMKNDLAFIIDCRLNLYEHQASVNPNMPLRNLFYIVKEYQSMIGKRSLYSSRLVKLPTPHFIVFYNGQAEQPERKEMRLSDAFLTHEDEPSLELKVVQLNIGIGHNKGLMEKCPTLAQYSQYVGRVQKYASAMPLEQAVEKAVAECIREDILSDFLQKNRAEAIAVSIFEYDEEKELALLRAAEREEGIEQGLILGREQGLQQGLIEGHAQGLAEGHTQGLAEGHTQGLAEGHTQGLAEGHIQGLRALISTLKEFCANPEEIYAKVTQNPIYAELTREDFESYL